MSFLGQRLNRKGCSCIQSQLSPMACSMRLQAHLLLEVGSTCRGPSHEDDLEIFKLAMQKCNSRTWQLLADAIWLGRRRLASTNRSDIGWSLSQEPCKAHVCTTLGTARSRDLSAVDTRSSKRPIQDGCGVRQSASALRLGKLADSYITRCFVVLT